MASLWLGLGMAIGLSLPQATLPQAANGGGGGISFAPRAPQDDACGAAALQHLVGGPVGAIEGLELRGPLRVHAVDAMITMDHIPSRLNVVTDPAGAVILAIRCG